MGDVYMVNGKILSGLPNHAKDIEFDNTGTTLSSTNTEDAIKEVNSNLSNNVAIKTFTDSGTVLANDGVDISNNISVSGYTPIAVIAFNTGSYQLALTSVYISSGTTSHLLLRNLSASDRSYSISYAILYTKIAPIIIS